MGTKEGVVKARSFMRRGSDSERWGKIWLEQMCGTPWAPVPGTEGQEIRPNIHWPSVYEGLDRIPMPIAEERRKTVRRLYVTRAMASDKKFGKTKGCEACVAINRGLNPQNSSL